MRSGLRRHRDAITWDPARPRPRRLRPAVRHYHCATVTPRPGTANANSVSPASHNHTPRAKPGLAATCRGLGQTNLKVGLLWPVDRIVLPGACVEHAGDVTVYSRQVEAAYQLQGAIVCKTIGSRTLRVHLR
jgi:hypothetical protein